MRCRRIVRGLACLVLATLATAGGGGAAQGRPQAATQGATQAATQGAEVDPSRFGARCDRQHDDSAAFDAALAAAIGGAASANGGAVLAVPAGRCRLSHALVAHLAAQTALVVRGQGMFVSELVQTGGTDGLDFIFPAGGSQDARTAAAPGQSVQVRDLSIVQADPGARTIGRGLALIGPDPQHSKVPFTAELIEHVEFRAQLGSGVAGRPLSTTQNWASDITIEDVGNVRITDGEIVHYDYGDGSERDIDIISRSPRNRLEANAPGGISIMREDILGGHVGIDVEGNNIQGVSVLDTPITAVAHAVLWNAAAQGTGFNGPLVVRDSSISAQADGIVAAGISSIFITDNLIIDGQPRRGTNWCGICLDSAWAAVVSNNILENMPNTATLGPGLAATGLRLDGWPERYPSVVADNSIGPADVGLALGGPIAASNNILLLAPSVPETCYRDISRDETHPALTQLMCGAHRIDRGPAAAAAPASDHTPCIPGQEAWDQHFAYRCVAPDRWRRTALSDW